MTNGPPAAGPAEGRLAPGRGLLFALGPDALAVALALGEAADLARLRDRLERTGARVADVDKSWPILHRCLGCAGGGSPLARAVLGGRPLSEVRGTVTSLVDAAEVGDIWRALEALDEETFRGCYDTTQGDPDGESEEMDRLYAWDGFKKVRALYRAAAAEGRAVLFVARAAAGS
jgi:hypothetical protein